MNLKLFKTFFPFLSSASDAKFNAWHNYGDIKTYEFQQIWTVKRAHQTKSEPKFMFFFQAQWLVILWVREKGVDFTFAQA